MVLLSLVDRGRVATLRCGPQLVIDDVINYRCGDSTTLFHAMRAERIFGQVAGTGLGPGRGIAALVHRATSLRVGIPTWGGAASVVSAEDYGEEVDIEHTAAQIKTRTWRA